MTRVPRNPTRAAGGPPSIDRDKLRVALHRLKREALLDLLDRALDHVPGSRLSEIIAGHVEPDRIRSDAAGAGHLLDTVKRFHEASLRGDYFEDFAVNSKNFMCRSAGTETWMEECNRLLGRSVACAGEGGHAEAQEAFALLFDLLERINHGEDVIFFADEGGAWQVGVDWDVVLPAWFTCLAATAQPEDFAHEVVRVVDEFEHHDRERHLKTARAVATPQQRTAL